MKSTNKILREYYINSFKVNLAISDCILFGSLLKIRGGMARWNLIILINVSASSAWHIISILVVFFCYQILFEIWTNKDLKRFSSQE